MLSRLILQNFRSYSAKNFDFNPAMTIIIGPNTAGKTNLVESIMLLATGKSFRAQKDIEMICFGEEIARVQGLVNTTKLEVTVAQGTATGGRFLKRFAVNDVVKSRANFVGNLPAVLFNPEALEIIIDGPSLRREFFNDVLESVDIAYRHAKTTYEKALRQRNALLDVARDTGIRNTEQFAYWDELLISNGQLMTEKREAFVAFVNASEKDIFDFEMIYDKSVMSRERLDQYKDAEIGAGNTLVGPQRDDFYMLMHTPAGKQNVQHFGSRGQQRLVILQLKLLHIAYVEKKLEKKPLLVLDDIFSELDDRHIALVLEKVVGRQVILTTTHEEFVKDIAADASMIQLNK